MHFAPGRAQIQATNMESDPTLKAIALQKARLPGKIDQRGKGISDDLFLFATKG
jgi:hypothetical protein